MSSLLRKALVLLVAAWLAIPTVCDEGGENNGGTGVWILPACANVPATGAQGGAPVRGQFERSDASTDVKMELASQMSSAVATFVDEVSGSPVALPVTGRIVTVPKQLLQTLKQTALTGSIIISDAAQRGYVLGLQVSSAGVVKISVY